MKNHIFFIALALLLTACESTPNFDGAQYWQRREASDMAYTTGPKAQQMLNRNIARCVTELRELERQNQIKDSIPTDYRGRVLNPDEMALAGYDSPDRQGHLLTEHSDYYDFESCMVANGWERVKHVPYDVAKKGEGNYLSVLGSHLTGTYEAPDGENNDYRQPNY